MAFIKVNAFVLSAFLSAACSLNAQVPNDVNNGSFDANSTLPTSWQIDPNGYPPEIISLPTTFIAYDNNKPVANAVTIAPFDGNNFVLLHSGDGSRLGEDYSYCQLSQKIAINAGQSIRGEYFFSTVDYIIDSPNPTGNYRYNDHAYIKLIPMKSDSGLVEITLAYKDVNSVGSYGSGSSGCMLGWATFHHTFDSNNEGSYKLVLKVKDVGDTIYSSYLAVDALKLCYPPPGDINKDCVVNFYDFALLANQWLNICNDSTWCHNCDIDKISKDDVYAVDFGDLAILAANWLIDCGVTPLDTACEPPSPQ